MSSPSKKPYQSRLLNLVNRYYIKINSQFQVKLREWGYVIQGGLQKVVVPFLWLWQSGNKIGQSFSSTSGSNHSLPKGDRSLVNTDKDNQLIETLHQNITHHPLFNSLSTENWQGLATRLKDKQIVVITANNKIKNLIPSAQQDDLKFLINQTLSNYHKTTTKSFIEVAKQTFNDLLPIQRKEEKILNKKYKNKLYSSSLLIKENPLLHEIIDASQQKLQEIIPVVQGTTSNLVVRGVNQLQVASNSINKSIEEDPFQIKLLIIEAIKYFLNKSNNQQNKLLKLLKNNQISTKFTQTEIKIIQEQNTEPWLSWEDLYKEPKSLPAEDIPEIEILIEPEEKVILDHLHQTQKHPEPSGKLSPNQIFSSSTTTTITVTPSTKTKKVVVKNTKKVTQTVQSRDIELKKPTVNSTVKIFHKEAIEAKVVEIKYEKHLLEIVLEKLDQLIVWLEEKTIKLISILKFFVVNFIK